MKSMNLFGNTKPEKKTYTEEFKKKAVSLASQFGVTGVAEKLGVSTSSIYSWKKTVAKSSATIQDEDGNLTFELEWNKYSLNVNSAEERKRVKDEVNANSLTKYNWFKENTGKKHWVLYNTEMYEVTPAKLLHYREWSGLIPVIPINATSCCCMFIGCATITKLDLSYFNTSEVTDMNNMFSCCYSLTQLDLSNFNTRNVTNMCGMFNSSRSLTQLDLSNFDTSQVTNMRMMFYGCYALTQLDISNFNTSKVTDLEWMFSDCLRLTQLDLSNFDTSQVIIMKGMFYNCKELTQLDISNFNTREVVTMTEMFAYCIRLTDIFISNKWNINRVDFSFHMFVDCLSLPNFNEEKTDIKMAKPVEEGGYLTLKN